MKKCEKVRFATEKDAKKRLKELKPTNPTLKSVYRCYCGAWHMTSHEDVNVYKQKIKALEVKLQQIESTHNNRMCAFREKDLKTIKALQQENRKLVDELIKLKHAPCSTVQP